MSIKKSLCTAVLVMISLVFSSCIGDLFGITGKGSIVSKSCTVKDFQSVTLNSAANVDVVKGDSFKVEVSDYENLLSYHSVTVSNHILMISKVPASTLLNNSKAKVTITMPDSLIHVTLNGSGDINVNSAFKDLMSTEIFGSGNINANQSLNIAKLNANIYGSGNIAATGKVDSLKAIITGSGNIDFSTLRANYANCTISGSGNISVAVVITLKATISGSGNVYYYGTPNINATMSGSGAVLKKY